MLPQERNPSPQERSSTWLTIRQFISERFSLEEDKADETEIIQAISRGIEFRGTNLWALIFAILIASIGLDVNSTSFLFGAMLISPLMGPIMGIGLGVGINDLELIKRAFKNLSIAAIISLITSTLYFLVSPLQVAQSELLARTSPTIWDAAIAFLGGLAGIVAGSRRDKVSNVILGVAIATALMPPLCTAGYGIANGNFSYFIRAFYMFLINGVCISLATYLIVRFLGYQKKEYPNPVIEQRVKNTILIAVLIVLVPSTYLGYQIVRKTIFEQAAKRFIANEGNFQYRQVVNYTTRYQPGKSNLELMVVGEPMPPDSIQALKAKMPAYGLGSTALIIRQGALKDSQVDVNTITSTVTDQIIKYSQNSLARKDQIIDSLQRHIELVHASGLPVADLRDELRTLMPDVQTFTAARSLVMSRTGSQPDTVLLVYARFSRRHQAVEKKRIENWLRSRTKSRKIKLIVE